MRQCLAMMDVVLELTTVHDAWLDVGYDVFMLTQCFCSEPGTVFLYINDLFGQLDIEIKETSKSYFYPR